MWSALMFVWHVWTDVHLNVCTQGFPSGYLHLWCTRTFPSHNGQESITHQSIPLSSIAAKSSCSCFQWCMGTLNTLWVAFIPHVHCALCRRCHNNVWDSAPVLQFPPTLCNTAFMLTGYAHVVPKGCSTSIWLFGPSPSNSILNAKTWHVNTTSERRQNLFDDFKGKLKGTFVSQV